MAGVIFLPRDVVEQSCPLNRLHISVRAVDNIWRLLQAYVASLNNADRERAIGQRWKELSTAEKAAYKQGLTLLPSFGRGAGRFWAPTPPGDPTPANDVARLSELVPYASL